MLTRFENRVVVVTGAARGIGVEIAQAFAGEGARLALLDVDAGSLEAVGRDLRASGHEALDLAANVTRAAEVGRAVSAVVERWGRVDFLLNNAGGFAVIRTTEEISEEEWNAIVALNLTSVFLCCRAVLPVMRRQAAGRIVNVASVVGRGGAVRVTSHYAAAKAGVARHPFTRHLALEAGPAGITVNAVAPGTTATERVLKARTPADPTRGRDDPAAPAGRAARDRSDRPVPRLR